MRTQRRLDPVDALPDAAGRLPAERVPERAVVDPERPLEGDDRLEAARLGLTCSPLSHSLVSDRVSGPGDAGGQLLVGEAGRLFADPLREVHVAPESGAAPPP